jgi:bifunctional DNase/RNase
VLLGAARPGRRVGEYGATIAGMVPMELVGVRLELPANTPIVILRETEGRRRVVPIYIGGPEAAAIHYALEGIEPARPLTHDLLKNVLDELTTSLDRVVVTEVRDRTYYAELHLVNAAGTHTVSSRPSDAIALAVRTQTPIFAEESLLDEVGQEQEELAVVGGEDDEDELLEDFRDFIENVKPEDFEAP